ncbi:hypothetical protein RJT34_20321 [Clitoria ternatea]|uniref:Uncharacterized protein n=1 Tax=Clitoria ternatea TaxID=43366 RepID=A0AAN9P5N3_CLITE
MDPSPFLSLSRINPFSQIVPRHLFSLTRKVQDAISVGGNIASYRHLLEPFSHAQGHTARPFRKVLILRRTLVDGPVASRRLDLASTLEVGSGNARPTSEADLNGYNLRSVLTIAFQFTFENHLWDNVAAMARQYVRSIVGSVQRVAMAITPSRLSTQLGPKSHPGSPEAFTLARWICRSYRIHTGTELFRVECTAGDAILKQLFTILMQSCVVL